MNKVDAMKLAKAREAFSMPQLKRDDLFVVLEKRKTRVFKTFARLDYIEDSTHFGLNLVLMAVGNVMLFDEKNRLALVGWRSEGSGDRNDDTMFIGKDQLREDDGAAEQELKGRAAGTLLAIPVRVKVEGGGDAESVSAVNYVMMPRFWRPGTFSIEHGADPGDEVPDDE